MITADHFQLSCHFHKEPFGYPWWNGLFNEKYAHFYWLNAKLQHFKIYLDTFEQIQPFEGKI